MSVQGKDIFRFGSSQTTVTMDSSDNHSSAHNNDAGSHHPDENDKHGMDDLNPLPVDITFDNDDAMADPVPGVLDGTTTTTITTTGFNSSNNHQSANQSVASNNSNTIHNQSTNQSVASHNSNCVPMMMGGVPVPGGSIGGSSYPAYPADNGDVDAWAAHMQRLLMAKDSEIRFLRQELANANRQLHVLCPPSARNIANVAIPGAVPGAVTTNGNDMNGTYNNTTVELDPNTPRTQNPRRSSSSSNNRRSKKPKEERIKIENEIISDPYGDQGIYTGMILKATRMPHGTGHMKYEGDNRVYDGQWRYGRWHGFGKAYFANGDTYVGDYNMDRRHGHGKYQWQDGRAYDGQFHEDSRHGEGIFAWPDGSAYVSIIGVSCILCMYSVVDFSQIYFLARMFCYRAGRAICEWSARRAGHICL